MIRLRRISEASTPKPVTPAVSGLQREAGRIVLAAPGQDRLVHDGTVLLVARANENGHRPAIDPLFCSSARWLR